MYSYALLSRISSAFFTNPHFENIQYFFHCSPSVFIFFISYKKIEKISDCFSFFLVSLEISLLHVTFCSLIIAAFPRAIQHRISAKKCPLSWIKGPKCTKELTFSYSLKTAEIRRQCTESITILWSLSLMWTPSSWLPSSS